MQHLLRFFKNLFTGYLILAILGSPMAAIMGLVWVGQQVYAKYGEDGVCWFFLALLLTIAAAVIGHACNSHRN